MSSTITRTQLDSRQRPEVTYAQARLWLGITCVGFQVLLAATALWTALPERLVPALSALSGSSTLAMLALFCLLAAVQLPFDVLGGFLLPARFTGIRKTATMFLRQLMRGISVQGVVFAFVFLLYQQVGSVAGNVAVVCVFAIMQLVLLSAQESIARWTGRLTVDQTKSPDAPLVLHGRDTGMTGGITGLPGWDRVVVPAAWGREYADEVREAAVTRRRLIITSGMRRRGVTAAVLWNTALLAVALWLPGGGSTSLVALTKSYLHFSLLSFIGLLVLPVFSRRAVFAADQLAAQHSGTSLVEKLATCADQVPEGEPTRSAQRESVFHPVPCRERRLTALRSSETATNGWWNVARTVLYCSWAFGGPLSRSVHCNIGRPELWVLLPTD